MNAAVAEPAARLRDTLHCYEWIEPPQPGRAYDKSYDNDIPSRNPAVLPIA